ncbi:hypothetical protein DFH09DRAFT_1325749 [Mycena vulgaris]|nr:hypothetical protein DFH09DRAFT_1325749 [Mycena vulgaris]
MPLRCSTAAVEGREGLVEPERALRRCSAETERRDERRDENNPIDNAHVRRLFRALLPSPTMSSLDSAAAVPDTLHDRHLAVHTDNARLEPSPSMLTSYEAPHKAHKSHDGAVQLPADPPPTIEPFSVVGPSTLVTSTGDIYNPSSRDASPTPTPPAAAQTPPPHSPADTTMSDNVDMSGAQGPAPPPYGAGVAPPPVQPPPAPAPAPAPQDGQPAPAPAPAPALAPGVEQLTQPAQPFVHVDANRSTREWTIGHYNTAVARGDPAEIERYAHTARIRTIMGNPDIVRIVDQLTQARGSDRLHRVFAAVWAWKKTAYGAGQEAGEGQAGQQRCGGNIPSGMSNPIPSRPAATAGLFQVGSTGQQSWHVQHLTARSQQNRTRKSTQWLEGMMAPPPVALLTKVTAKEGIWLTAARRRTGTATNPSGKDLPGEPMKNGSKQLWALHAHQGAPAQALTCSTHVGLSTSTQPLQGETLKALRLKHMSAEPDEARELQMYPMEMSIEMPIQAPPSYDPYRTYRRNRERCQYQMAIQYLQAPNLSNPSPRNLPNTRNANIPGPPRRGGHTTLEKRTPRHQRK